MTKQLFYSQTLPLKTAVLLGVFQRAKPAFLNHFYLSGGTALSLQIGHRESEDLDFFTAKDFNPQQLQTTLERFGKLENLQLDKNTLNTFLKGVQLQFLTYPYPLLKPTINWKGIKISSLIDIGCTKLQTIAMREEKKDFIDLYFLFQQYSFKKLWQALEQKYKKANFNKVHILKSLVYFKNIDSQPMPKMHQDIAWEKIKDFIMQISKEQKLEA